MYRSTLRPAARPLLANLRASRTVPRRFASSASPANTSRSWKSSAVRWGLAFGAVYYYTTSPVFADEAASQTITAPASFSDADLPTVESVVEEKRKLIKPPAEKKPAETKPAQTDAAQTAAVEGSPAALEEEAGQQGAFNPETGEINWDCPCLGGMADGPCGEEFKTAFSCFVYSNEEPKGMDCIDKFQNMQTCFKKYPEIYGAELADDEDDQAPTPEEGQMQSQSQEPSPIAKLPAENATKETVKESVKQNTKKDVKKDTKKDAAPSKKVAPVDDASPNAQPGEPQAAAEDPELKRIHDATAAEDPEMKRVHDATAANNVVKQ